MKKSKKRIILVSILIISLILPCLAVSAESIPVITKNPTSEAISIGGKTWFIAHADNATSLTWEMIDPNGYVHTLAEAMAMNPGLNLQALEGDTIAVSNVPQSVNGWGVQATFTGPGGSVSTSPAYIYVGDFLNAYSGIIEKYRLVAQLGYIDYCNRYSFDICECAKDCEYTGYALKDIDKNGIPELIISGGGKYYGAPSILFELYTLENNVPVNILISYPRIRFYLLTDNRIYYEASGGAAYSYFEFFKLNGDHLEFLEGYATANDADAAAGQAGRTLYHTSVWNGATEPFMTYGDYNRADQTWPIDISENNNTIGALFDTFGSQCWIPQLTMIA